MVSAIIPTMTNDNGLFKLVNQLKKIKDIEIIIVDNKPNENKKEKLKKFIYLPQSKNLGFAKAVNLGVKKAKSKWLLILNDDIELESKKLKIKSQKLVKDILNFAQENNLDAVSPVLIKPNGKVENLGYKVLPIGRVQLIKNQQKPINKKNLPITNNEIDGLTAACLFIKKDIFEKVGGFDESFFAYLEDVDFFLRLKKKGFRFGIDPKTFVIHNHMTTSSKMGWLKEKQDFINWIRVILKNWGIKKIILNLPGIVIERGRNLSSLIKKIIKVYFFSVKKLIFLIFIFFFFLFIFFSFKTMKHTPFHDFDEANRAEAVKNMKEYRFFLAPLTGSPFLRNEKLTIKVKDNPNLYLFIHLERPPLFFWLTAISTSLFGDSELSYRLPSFLFGLATILITFFLHPLSLLSIIQSTDLWLSSQNALMDTMLTFFLFISFLTFLKAINSKNKLLYFLTGLFWGLSFLAKGQPAIIFTFPLIFSFFLKKINLKNLFLILFGFLIIVVPWIFLVIYNFGFDNFVLGFLGFASKRTLSSDPTQQAPIFWYLRWWFESLRVGSVLFFVLLINDFLTKKFDFKKMLILSYFIPSFLLFSLAKNKVWWYVLPLIPVVSLYLHYSVFDILKADENKIFNLLIIVFISSLPIFFGLSNKLALIVEVLMITFGVLILKLDFDLSEFIFNANAVKRRLNFILNLFRDLKTTSFIYPIIIFFSLFFFTFRFPKITPNFPEAKKVGEYYQKLTQPKCLFVKDIPYEAILFYTNAKEVNYLGQKPLFKNCKNYLITQDTNLKYQKIFQHKRLILYKL